MSTRTEGVVNEIVSSLALAAFSAAVAVGFARVFSGWDFLGDLLVIVAVGHGLSLLARLVRIPGLVATLIVGVALAWLLCWVNFRPTMSGILPTADTWEALRSNLDAAGKDFRTSVAPVAYAGGWSTLASLALAAAVYLSDIFAFQARARGESLVPAGVLFVFVAAVGIDRERLLFTMLVIAAGIVAVVALRVRDRDTTRTILGSRRAVYATTLPGALAAAGIVALLAGTIGPRLPGAGEDPLVDTGGRESGETTVSSPIVDIRSRLVNQSDTELFTVAANEPAYWRLVALPSFDGQRWRLPDRGLEQVDGALSEAAPGATEIDQTLTISALTGSFVPAAAQPVAASPGDELRYNADTSALIDVDGQVDSGATYRIQSARPNFDPAALRAATTGDPPDDEYLALPDSLPAEVRDEAAAVTASGSTPYDQVLLLQNWFRDNFTYSIDVPPGHDNDAILQFLANRTGYCEQFAGTFAAMARSLGIPARVAVGFTQGDLVDSTYVVRGRNTHAWPEVWFDDLGWVPFEPTPGRGAPGSEQYTGVPPQQEGSPPPTTTIPPTTTTEPSGGQTPPPAPPTTTTTTTVAGSLTPLENDSSSLFPAWLWWVLAALAALGVLAALPALSRRWHRRHDATGTADYVRHLWERAERAVRPAGLRPAPAMTPLEFAAVAGEHLPMMSDPLRALAGMTTRVTYAGPDAIDALEHDERDQLFAAAAWTDEIEQISESMLSPADRMRRHFTTWR